MPCNVRKNAWAIKQPKSSCEWNMKTAVHVSGTVLLLHRLHALSIKVLGPTLTISFWSYSGHNLVPVNCVSLHVDWIEKIVPRQQSFSLRKVEFGIGAVERFLRRVCSEISSNRWGKQQSLKFPSSWIIWLQPLCFAGSCMITFNQRIDEVPNAKFLMVAMDVVFSYLASRRRKGGGRIMDLLDLISVLSSIEQLNQ